MSKIKSGTTTIAVIGSEKVQLYTRKGSVKQIFYAYCVDKAPKTLCPVLSVGKGTIKAQTLIKRHPELRTLVSGLSWNTFETAIAPIVGEVEWDTWCKISPFLQRRCTPSEMREVSLDHVHPEMREWMQLHMKELLELEQYLFNAGYGIIYLDRQIGNYGIYDGKLVAIDPIYAMEIA